MHDRDVGWVRMGYRDYNPLTARFTAKDPIGHAGGEDDLYGYCCDDPVNFNDPTGMFIAGGAITVPLFLAAARAAPMVARAARTYGPKALKAIRTYGKQGVKAAEKAGKATSGGFSASIPGTTLNAGVDAVKGDGYTGTEYRGGAAIGLPIEGSVSKDFTYVLPLPKFFRK